MKGTSEVIQYNLFSDRNSNLFIVWLLADGNQPIQFYTFKLFGECFQILGEYGKEKILKRFHV